jgi:RimK family alpha-L-glutamate ligase
MTQVAVIGWPQETNEELVAAWRERGLPASLLSPLDALWVLGRGDVAIGRLDVVRSLDGVEPGLDVLGFCERAGVRVLNRATALLNAHDKLLTARRLLLAGVPHPKSVFVAPAATGVSMPTPLVLKPRFGSWGRDVIRCDSEADVAAALETISTRTWFQRQGALAQELVPPVGFDLRLLVAGGRVVGAVERIAAPGEWRTNVSLGGSRRPVEPPDEAVRLGLAAVDAIEGDLVGVDLLPVAGGHIILELNGAMEFDETYDLPGGDVYLDTARALELIPSEVAA